MKYLIIILILALIGFFAFPKIVPWLIEQPVVVDKLEEIGSTKISKELAVENVKKLPEVVQYLKDVPNGKVEVDNELEGEYNVHVYEVKNGHTATFNWYKVSIKSGEVRAEFQVEQNEQQQTSRDKNGSPKITTGTLAGKICYPSEAVPKGKLEVKRLSDGKITEEDYPGSIEGVATTYSFQLEEGTYYVRYKPSLKFSDENYKVAENLIGYSTTVCPTGQEETCGDTKQRVLRKAEVKTNQTVSGYDLCDYYYNSSNAPKF